jgi:hypothetical protein
MSEWLRNRERRTSYAATGHEVVDAFGAVAPSIGRPFAGETDLPLLAAETAAAEPHLAAPP